MNWKSFIIASVIIHLAGGTALYFYYNPIRLNPKPVSQKEKRLDEKSVKKDLSQETKKFFPHSAGKKINEIAVPPVLSASKDLSEPSLKEKPAPILKKKPVQNEASEDIKSNQTAEKKTGKPREDIQGFFQLKQKAGNPPLSYPDFARRLGMQGAISLLFFLDERGLVEKIQLENSTGHPDLDNFVLRTLSRYQFEENQEGWTHYRNSFVLEGEEKEYLRLRKEQEGLAKKEGIFFSKEISKEKGNQKKNENSREESEFVPESLNPQSAEKKTQDNLEETEEVEFIDYENLEEVNPIQDNQTEEIEESSGG